jgi:hypothetical protein
VESSISAAVDFSKYEPQPIAAARSVLTSRRATMKLQLTKDQAKGLLGGVKFELAAKVDLTSEESELVRKYKAEKEVLLKREIKIPLTGKSIVLNLTIASLTSGQSFTCGDIGEILEYESNIKESCANFKNYIEVMKHFGGQEVIQY